MNTKASTGLLLLAAAAALGWLWWQRRNDPAAVAAGQTDAGGDLSGLKQVGSNFTEDSSADVVKAALEYSASFIREQEPCWKSIPDPANPGWAAWYRTAYEYDTKQFHRLPVGREPSTGRVC